MSFKSPVVQKSKESRDSNELKVKKRIKVVTRKELIRKELENPFHQDFSALKEKVNIWDPNPKLIEKAYRNVCELWVKDNKSKNFLKHLISGFLPYEPFMKLFSKPDNEVLKCAILGINLTGIKNISEAVASIGMKKMFIEAHCCGENRDISPEEIKELMDARAELSIEVRESSFANMSDTSDKILSMEAIIALEYLIKKLLFMDEYTEEISAILLKLRTTKNNEDADDSKTKQILKSVKKVSILSDNIDIKSLDALQKMKFDLEEKTQKEQIMFYQIKQNNEN